MGKLTISEKEKIKDLYLQGYTIKEIKNLFFKDKDISENSINYTLRNYNITRPRGKSAQINHNYFNVIDTEIKAYFIGFILADGSVSIIQKSKNGFSYKLRLEIQQQDEYILHRLTKELNSNLEIKYTTDVHYFNNYIIKKNNAYVHFFSKQIVTDLAKYNIIPNKTFLLTELPKNIPQHLYRHMIRGFFDGDGTVYLTNNNKILSFGFYGSYDLLLDIRQHLHYNIGTSNTKTIFFKPQNNISYLSYAAYKDIINFYDYIYRDSTIFLIRKKEKFDYFLQNK